MFQGSDGRRNMSPAQDAYDVPGSVQYLVDRFAEITSSEKLRRETPAVLNLEAIDDSLSRVLLQVRTLRNSTLPVMRLPPDILEIIFSMLQDQFPLSSPIYPFYGLGSPDRPYQLSGKWIRVMHVCRYWRDTALSRSSLWTTISVRRRNDTPSVESSLLQTSLCRSYSRLLSVQIHPRDLADDDANSVVTLLNQLPRIKELSLFGSLYPEEYRVLQEQTAPNLETLTMRALLRQPNGAPELSCLPRLFRGDTSSIKFFAVLAIHPFQLNRFGNLRQLHMVNQDFTTSEDLQSFLDVLECNLGLEDLMVTRINLLAWDLNVSGRRANAPSLRRICFQNMDATVVNFFLSSLQLSTKYALQVLSDTPQLFYDLLRGFRPLTNFKCLRAAKLHLWNRSCDISGVGAAFAWYAEMCAVYDQATAVHLGQELSPMMGSVEEIWINDCLDQEDDENDIPARYSLFFEIIFAAAPALRKLVLQSTMWDDMGLSHALAAPEATAVVCPQLATLEVHGIQAKLWNPLVDFLTRRKAAGAPIQVLNVYSSNWDNEEARRTFDDWQERAPAEVAPLVQEANLVRVGMAPQIRLPSVCALHSRGRWDWPSWQSIGDAQV